MCQICPSPPKRGAAQQPRLKSRVNSIESTEIKDTGLVSAWEIHVPASPSGINLWFNSSMQVATKRWQSKKENNKNVMHPQRKLTLELTLFSRPTWWYHARSRIYFWVKSSKLLLSPPALYWFCISLNISFQFLSEVMEMGLWLGQGTQCNKRLSLSYR